jgi:TonB family protein
MLPNGFPRAGFAVAVCVLAGAAAYAADPAADKQQSMAKLRAAIVKNITTPCGVKPTQRLELKVVLQDNGYVESMRLVQSSGAAAFDAAVMVAIARAQPYKLPADAAARKGLRNLDFKIDAFATPLPPCEGKKVIQ